MREAQILEFRAPHTDQAETAMALESAQALIGCILADATRFREVSHVQPEHFAEPFHGRLWAVVSDLIASGRSPEIATVTDRIADDPALKGLGGKGYIFDLWDHAGASHLARQHAESVTDAFVRRAGASILGEAARALLGNPDRPAAAVLGETRNHLETLEREGSAGDGDVITAEDAADDLLNALDTEAVHGLERGAMTGLRCFDVRLRGLRPGWLVVVGARPSMGKSGLARAAAYGCAECNPESAVLFFSLEMDARECAERALSAATHIDGDGIAYSGFGAGLSGAERARLRQLRATMPRNLLIDDRSSIGLDDVRRRVWAIKAQRPVAAVFIDYLQLMTKPPAAGRNDAAVLGDLTRGLKQLAREADTCVVVLSQLSRQVEGRDDKRPHLSDLRDSGSIEQDANAVLFPYREAYYLERAEPKNASRTEREAWTLALEASRRSMDVIAAKCRGGAIGTDRQAYYAEFDHVADAA